MAASKQSFAKQDIIEDMFSSLTTGIVNRWYPLVIDNEFGGYFTNVDCNWQLLPEQEKMIVTQARHVWTLSKISVFFNNKAFANFAMHGFDFLKNDMWDKKTGGFYQMRGREGGLSDVCGFRDEKRTYGNAFAIYGLAALYDVSRDEDVLNLAKTAFSWVESHAFDPINKGYFQFLGPDGKWFDKNSNYKTIAYDDIELGYKDQNSSIHLLEAYTELYSVWKDDLLKSKLNDLLLLIRDVITTSRGYMTLFFDREWKPVSLRDAPSEIREANYRLDHVSFGHDYETAFLLLEASHTLGIENDVKTLANAKKMVDHALDNGFDTLNGGFYDEAYYFLGSKECSVIKDTKNWWAQAEALNAYLMMSLIFPEEEKYYNTFLKQWEYVNKYIIDHDNGDWFEGGIDKEPQFKTGPKSHMWKCTYHTCRALMNCITMLADEKAMYPVESPGFVSGKKKSDEFIDHWKKTAQLLK